MDHPRWQRERIRRLSEAKAPCCAKVANSAEERVVNAKTEGALLARKSAPTPASAAEFRRVVGGGVEGSLLSLPLLLR